MSGEAALRLEVFLDSLYDPSLAQLCAPRPPSQRALVLKLGGRPALRLPIPEDAELSYAPLGAEAGTGGSVSFESLLSIRVARSWLLGPGPWPAAAAPETSRSLHVVYTTAAHPAAAPAVVGVGRLPLGPVQGGSGAGRSGTPGSADWEPPLPPIQHESLQQCRLSCPSSGADVGSVSLAVRLSTMAAQPAYRPAPAGSTCAGPGEATAVISAEHRPRGSGGNVSGGGSTTATARLQRAGASPGARPPSSPAGPVRKPSMRHAAAQASPAKQPPPSGAPLQRGPLGAGAGAMATAPLFMACPSLQVPALGCPIAYAAPPPAILPLPLLMSWPLGLPAPPAHAWPPAWPGPVAAPAQSASVPQPVPVAALAQAAHAIPPEPGISNVRPPSRNAGVQAALPEGEGPPHPGSASPRTQLRRVRVKSEGPPGVQLYLSSPLKPQPTPLFLEHRLHKVPGNRSPAQRHAAMVASAMPGAQSQFCCPGCLKPFLRLPHSPTRAQVRQTLEAGSPGCRHCRAALAWDVPAAAAAAAGEPVAAPDSRRSAGRSRENGMGPAPAASPGRPGSGNCGTPSCQGCARSCDGGAADSAAANREEQHSVSPDWRIKSCPAGDGAQRCHRQHPGEAAATNFRAASRPASSPGYNSSTGSNGAQGCDTEARAFAQLLSSLNLAGDWQALLLRSLGVDASGAALGQRCSGGPATSGPFQAAAGTAGEAQHPVCAVPGEIVAASVGGAAQAGSNLACRAEPSCSDGCSSGSGCGGSTPRSKASTPRRHWVPAGLAKSAGKEAAGTPGGAASPHRPTGRGSDGAVCSGNRAPSAEASREGAGECGQPEGRRLAPALAQQSAGRASRQKDTMHGIIVRSQQLLRQLKVDGSSRTRASDGSGDWAGSSAASSSLGAWHEPSSLPEEGMGAAGMESATSGVAQQALGPGEGDSCGVPAALASQGAPASLPAACSSADSDHCSQPDGGFPAVPAGMEPDSCGVSPKAPSLGSPAEQSDGSGNLGAPSSVASPRDTANSLGGEGKAGATSSAEDIVAGLECCRQWAGLSSRDSTICSELGPAWPAGAEAPEAAVALCGASPPKGSCCCGEAVGVWQQAGCGGALVAEALGSEQYDDDFEPASEDD